LFPFVGDSVGGSHISTLELYSSLVDEGIHVLILLHECDGPLSQYLHNKKIPFSIMKVSRLAGESPRILAIIISILANFIRFSRFIKENKIDIIHGNDLRINLSWSLPGKIFTKGFVWHQRTLLSSSKLWFLIRYLCDFFVVISDAVMQSAPKNIKNNQKKVVFNPFNVSFIINKDLARSCIVERYNIPSDCFLLGCVGRIVDYKNIDFVIKNISNIYNNVNKDVYLIIAGTGSKEYVGKLKKITYNVGINNRVVFTGFVSNPDEIISSLDLLVAPSIIDAFGRSIVEAMIQKTPVLAAKSGGHIDLIDEGNNGLFYDPSIQGDFIKIFSGIVDSKNINKLTDKAYNFAQANFSSKQHLDNILSVYRNLFKS